MSIPLAKDVALAISFTLLTGCAGSAATRPASSKPATPKATAIRPAGDKPCEPPKPEKKADPASAFLDLDGCPASQPASAPGKTP